MIQPIGQKRNHPAPDGKHLPVMLDLQAELSCLVRQQTQRFMQRSLPPAQQDVVIHEADKEQLFLILLQSFVHIKQHQMGVPV